MNSKVHPLFALLVVVLVLLAVIVGMWGSGQAKQIGGPAQLLIDPSGHLYVQIQNFLLEHDPDGRFVEQHDLSKLGVERTLGAISFFSNGEMLLRRGGDTRTLLDNIRAYLRLSNARPLRSASAETGIYRCNLRTDSCLPFGSELIDFNAAFGMFIDTRTDDVYISDTTRHVLRKYSTDGEWLGESVDDFRFPNQLLVYDNRLYVADTNHHRIRVVEPRTDVFGTEISSVDVMPAEAQRNKQIWPTHIARVGDEWWINNMRTNMNDGDIYIFDENWVFQTRVGLPAGADPIAIKAFRGEVLVSDWNNDRIHRVATDGQLLGDFESTGLQDVIADSLTLRWQYQAYAVFSVVVFFLVVVALLIKGIATPSSRQGHGKTPRLPVPNEFPDRMIWIKPDVKVVRKIRLLTRIIGACLILIVPLTAYLVATFDCPPVLSVFIPPIIGIVFISLLLLWANRTNVDTAIGLHGNNITLRDHSGHDKTIPVDTVIYNETAIACPDMAVFLGRPQLPLYDPEVLKAQVFPRLGDAQSVSPWEMQIALIRMRHAHGWIALITFFGILSVGLWMLITHIF